MLSKKVGVFKELEFYIGVFATPILLDGFSCVSVVWISQAAGFLGIFFSGGMFLIRLNWYGAFAKSTGR